MINDVWKRPNFEKRHVYTRFSCHGFHFLICENIEFHDADENCICELCNEKCGHYHLKSCINRKQSLCNTRSAHRNNAIDFSLLSRLLIGLKQKSTTIKRDLIVVMTRPWCNMHHLNPKNVIFFYAVHLLCLCNKLLLNII